jgi:iron complex transport system permease protein
MNQLASGEELALSRGVNVQRARGLLLLSVSAMIGGVVSLCGPIGFVGLMGPHISRFFVGSDHRRLVPAAALFGGAFLTICDTAARTVLSPTELPVGIITALLGGPFFLWLLTRSKEGSVL